MLSTRKDLEERPLLSHQKTYFRRVAKGLVLQMAAHGSRLNQITLAYSSTKIKRQNPKNWR